jgi:FkbM family methyltransferase
MDAKAPNGNGVAGGPLVAWKRTWRHRSSLLVVGCLVALFAKENLFYSLQYFISVANTNEPSFPVQNSNLTHSTGDRRCQTQSSLASKQSKQHPPLSCTDIFHEDRNIPRPAGDPNSGAIHARYTSTDPYFWVALHKREFDATRWAIIEFGEYYEVQETKSFANIIRADAQERVLRHKQQQTSAPTSSLPPLHVIDVGGNIGWYTLVVIAAAMEQQYPIIVDVFEPNPRNHRRLCESLFLNEWLRHEQVAINLYPLGVTSTAMASDPTQTGRIGVSTSGTGSLAAMHRVNLTETVTFPLVSLDQMAKELDWMDSKQTISILKVDVEGFELEVLQGAQELLKSQTIQHVFFEGNLRKKIEHGRFRKLVEIMVNNGYVAYKLGGFRGADTVVKTTWTAATDLSQYMDSLKEECAVPQRRPPRTQCNIWWRRVPSVSESVIHTVAVT